MSSNKIPFLDLVTPHAELEEELVDAFRKALHSAGFVGGAAVDAFERDFADFCAARFCVGTANGTDALRFALIAAGVRPGDVVVTVPNTFIATTEAISQAGARPAFVDIDLRTYTLDPEKLREFLETRCTPDVETGRLVERQTGSPVTAVLPVHLYGQMADMDAITELAAQYNLLVIEDACQAHGAEYFSRKRQQWCPAGSLAHAAAFSFYPGKNLGSCGEGGAVTTNDERIAAQCRMLREHGQSRKYHHEMEGYNGRLHAIQAAFLRIKLPHLKQWNDARRERARLYGELFAAAGDRIPLPFAPEWSRPVYHLYVVRVPERERLIKELEALGIGTGVHYPVPLHLSKAYDQLGHRSGDFPQSERACEEVLSLPMFPNLSMQAQQSVALELIRLVAPTAVAGIQ
jgi:dTDP-4-amino-4,6-dideoxygalactose transaminase